MLYLKYIATVLLITLSSETVCSKGELYSKCENHNDCTVHYSICNKETKRCECHNSTQKHGCACLERTLYVELGQKCTDSHQCAMAYSSCKNHVCTCNAGFKAAHGLCKAAGNFCPNFRNSPQNQLNSEKLCIENSNATSFDFRQAGNCSAEEFCFVHEGVRTHQHHRVGVCCHRPEHQDDPTLLVCPHGINDPQRRFCEDNFYWSENPNACPRESHRCIFYNEKGICCLKPCQSFGPKNHFSLDGRCYADMKDGEFCTHDIQCDVYASCKASKDNVKDKTCQCDHGVSNAGYCNVPSAAAGIDYDFGATL